MRQKKSSKLPVGTTCRNLKTCWTKNYNLFNVLADKTISPEQKKAMIHEMTDQQIVDFSRLVKDFCYNNRVKLRPKDKKKLAADKIFLQKMVSPDVPITEKRAVVEQQGGFLPFLLPLLAGVAGKPLIRAVGKNILGGAVKNIVGSLVKGILPHQK